MLKKTIDRFFYGITINELKLMNHVFVKTANITYNSLLYLDLISLKEDCTATYLADTLHISKSAVTMKVNELIKQGLVCKKQSEEDKRVFYLNLNEEAAALYLAYDRCTQAAIKEVEERYNSDEIAAFCRILDVISQKYMEETQNETSSD